MPLEIYCFYEKTWEKYEGITSDIFWSFTMSQFQLEIFEEPTGKDFRSLVMPPQRADVPHLYSQS
jgi:miniconductance mechanosensitive channel